MCPARCEIPSVCIYQRPGVDLFKCNEGALGKVRSEYRWSIQVGPEFTGLWGLPTGHICLITYQPHLVSGLMLPSGLSRPHPSTRLVRSQLRHRKRGLLVLQACLALKLPSKHLGIPLALCPCESQGLLVIPHPHPSPVPTLVWVCWVTSH